MEYGIFITERMQPMASKSKSIIGGMTVLGIAGIICKLVGVLFSIPLTYVIGAQGQGIYNAVFPTYNLLLTISSAGLPSRSAEWYPPRWRRMTRTAPSTFSVSPCCC